MSSSGNDLRDGAPADAAQMQLDMLDSPSCEERLRVRLSRRARRMSVRVYPDARVEVVAPPRARPGDIEQFVVSHRQWIDEKRALALRNRPAPEAFPPGTLDLSMTGETWRLQMAGGSGRPSVVERRTGSERVLQVSGSASAKLRPALRAWLLRAARERLEPRVAQLASALGVPYARVSIRRQKSRWGSCSARGTLSFNCCLLFQRPEVVDYLIIHELTHVSHMNHSARFWQAVERNCRNWRELDRELVQGWRRVPRWVFSEA